MVLSVVTVWWPPFWTRVSAAADRPARRRGSAHAKYSVSHHMTIKPFLLTRASCWIQISTVGEINSCCPTTIRSLWHSPANSVDSALDDQPFRRYVWCPPKFQWLTWPNHATFKDGLHCGLSLATVNLPSKFEVSNSTHYDNMKGEKNVKMEWFGVVGVTQSHQK